MSRFFTRLPSPAMAVALLALFVALGGTGYAALKLPKHSVGAKQLKNGAVTSPKIKNNTIVGGDVKESKLGPVPTAANASNSAKLGGVAAGVYARRSDLQSGALHLVKPLSSSFQCSPTNAGAFCEGGTPGQGWQNYGNGYAAVGYRRDPGGWVHLQGEATNTTFKNEIFYLPAGFRPLDATHSFTAVRCGGTDVTAVDVHTDGTVITPADCVSLEGITFHP